ncbi:hypothetical protein BHE74_00005538 [Ensete ventricosum]|nr:hypothetical protein BHE74_00005538 [Ensete ventricosum]
MDAKTFKALGVIRSCHDHDSVMTNELLVEVQKHYSISNKYALHASLSEHRPYGLFPNTFRLPQEKEPDETAWGKAVAKRVRRTKSVKELCQVPDGTRMKHYAMALIDRVHDAGQIISVMDKKMASLRGKIQELKGSTRSEVVVVAEKRAIDLQAKIDHLRTELNDVEQQCRELQKELDDTNLHHVDAHH